MSAFVCEKSGRTGHGHLLVILRVRSLGPASADSRPCECGLSALRVRTLGLASADSFCKPVQVCVIPFQKIMGREVKKTQKSLAGCRFCRNFAAAMG